MRSVLTRALIGSLSFGLAGDATAAEPAAGDSVWRIIAPHFEPGAEFIGKVGAHRSPLRFYDSRPVKTAADWPARRQEILDTWHQLMGPWPALIASPKVEVLEETRRENFTQRKMRLEIAPGQTLGGYLLIPEGRGQFPAVLVPYYDAETGAGLAKPLRDFGYQLTRRGFVSLSIGSPGGDARKPEVGRSRCQPLSFLAYVAANCANALATLPEVDAERIGVVGHSYGGKWAMFAACLYPKFACAVWSDPGIVFDESRPNVNYWDPWYLGTEPGRERPRGLPSPENPRTGAYRELAERGHDLHELHALMAPRPFLVSGGSEDPPARWQALNHSIAVNRLLGFTNRVAMTNRPKHDPTPESNEQIYLFFEHFLKRAVPPR
jgi:pimeloyl-ACP methyl ester carboxylesterase